MIFSVTQAMEESLDLMCEKCRAGQMVEYQRKLKSVRGEFTISGMRCDRCGYIQLDSDDDVWSTVGL